MTREWQKTGEGTYAFYAGGKETATMHILYNSLESRATLNTPEGKLTIRRTGFWKNKVEISGSNGQVLLKMYPGKWYAHYYHIEYNHQTYTLQIRNNPLSEFAITDTHQQLLLAYGLEPHNGKVRVRISASGNAEGYLFDYLLWYLFVPIASENMGEDLLFQMLVS